MTSETGSRGGAQGTVGYDGAGNLGTANADNQSAGNTYDGNGNPVGYGGSSLSFDANDKMIGLAVPAAPGITVPDSGFETPSVGSGGGAYQYSPSGSPWTFNSPTSGSNGTGIVGPGSAFGNPAAPEGSQAAFVQNTGSLSQSLSGFQAGVTYTLQVQAAQRSYNGTNTQSVRVQLDGQPVGTVTPSGTSYQAYTVSFQAPSSGAHTLSFVGLDPQGGDNTAFLDAVALTPAPATTLSSGYGPDGLRAWKRQGAGSPTYFVYDGADPVLETDGGGSVTALNTFGPTGLLARATGAGTTLYDFDERGDVAQRLDGSGNVLSSDLYGAYGRRASGNPGGDPFGFGGQAGYYTDAATGLCLLGQRYYDPGAGRFLSRDPAGYAGGQDLYAYADDDPAGSLDPSGLAPDCDADDGPQCDSQYTSDLYARDPGMVQAGIGAGNFFAHAAPGLGTLLDASDAETGCNALSGQPVSTGERVWDGVGALLAVAPYARFLRLPKCLFGCFVAGTPVQMGDGTTEPVQEVRTGDVVQSRDPDTGVTEARRVTATERHLAREVITVTLSDAATGAAAQALTATPEHPFFVAGRGPVPLGALAVGAQIVTRAGPPLVIASLDRHAVPGGVWVYNFTVAGDHTYFVGTADGGAWVHNKCYEAKLLRGPGGSVIRGRLISIGQAVERIRRGLDVLADTAREAKSLASSASPTNKVIKEIHGPPSDGYWWHYHSDPRTGSHVFFP